MSALDIKGLAIIQALRELRFGRLAFEKPFQVLVQAVGFMGCGSVRVRGGTMFPPVAAARRLPNGSAQPPPKSMQLTDTRNEV